MGSISKFRQIRRDGKVMKKDMTIDQILASGWEPDIVISIQWEYDGRAFEIRNPSGLLAKLFPGKDAIALLECDNLGSVKK